MALNISPRLAAGCSRITVRGLFVSASPIRPSLLSPAHCDASSGPRHPQRRVECTHSKPKTSGCSSTVAPKSSAQQLPLSSIEFWSSRPIWRRAGVNTLRCLMGCTAGDFSAMWFLQAYHPELGVGKIMALSMASGLIASFSLETALLRLGRDALPSWSEAARTAAGMSLISMLTMEAAENAVDWHLTGGIIALDDPWFWGAAAVSLGAGFATPLPWNYWRLRRLGKSCH
ncbi:hypothetical protein F5X68DRAFT_199179 [Plectosphaerella plurivora]|uniref:DUF4396 domain-containing protein n=1 Tax=Plectosphaerella plurivora TaxID=936078 RepID=A0A9P8VKJ6_9PEZI|nr:hypothetical protein F5X68DRAFT_199179 [Plectosphaerella plurivora]